MKYKNMSRESAEEYSSSLAQIGAGWWRQIVWAEQQGIPTLLGMDTRGWVVKYLGGYVKMLPKERREAIAELTEAGMSNRKIAQALGVAEGTVRNNKRPAQNYAPMDDNTNEIETEVAGPAQNYAPPRTVEIRRVDFRELLGSLENVDAIITDPPYERAAIPLYGELARLSKLALKPDGILAVMCGQSYLPEILPVMSAILPYRWTMAYLTPGGQSPQIWPKKVNTFWKPILLFGGAPDWIGDVVKSDVNDNDKRYHEWGQSESGMARLVESLTEPGQLVVDPFAGGGTTGVVCEALGRCFIGGDVHAEL